MAPGHDVIAGTAGHIDHGKTALVRALTGIDTDRLPEEKRRGISIDLGFAHLDLGDVHLGVVDVPGHERFVRNMLAGACGVDVAILVVAADDSVMPQTREHLAILQILGVRRGVIAITKTDVAEAGWIDAVEQEVRDLVAGTFLADAPLVRSSVVTGAGLDELKTALRAAAQGLEPRRPDDPFRLPVDRSFAIAGRGTVVTGTVWAGRARVGDELELLPGGAIGRVRGLQSHGADVDEVGSGRRAAVNLGGVHHLDVTRGHLLAAPGFLTATSRLTAHLTLLPGAPPLKHRAAVRLHLATAEVMARVELLDGATLDPGASADAQLICAHPVACVAGQALVLRAPTPAVTLGGGTVLQPEPRSPAKLRRRDVALRDRLAGLRSRDEVVRAAAAVYFRGERETTPADLCRDADVPLPRAAPLLERLGTDGVTVTLRASGRHAREIHRDRAAEIAAQIVAAMERLHATSPLDAAVPLESLLRRLPQLDREVALGVLEGLRRESIVAGDGATVALRSHRPALTALQQGQRRRVVEVLAGAGWEPPNLAALAKSCGADPKQLRPILELCSAGGELVRLGEGLYLHAECERRLRSTVGAALRHGGEPGLTVSQIKEALGTSRKYAVPICEHLDRVGLTLRVGDRRVLAGNCLSAP